jgi:hypothetical protein
MNPNFNVKLDLQGDDSPAGMHFVNNCIKRVSARMQWKGRKPSAKTLNKDTSQEGFRLFFGVDVLGSGDTNTMKILLENLLTLERNVDAKLLKDAALPVLMEVSFLGEFASFRVTEFTIMSINADQKSSYVEFEVKVVVV